MNVCTQTNKTKHTYRHKVNILSISSFKFKVQAHKVHELILNFSLPVINAMCILPNTINSMPCTSHEILSKLSDKCFSYLVSVEKFH